MTQPEPITFTPDELKPLGTFYSNSPIGRWHSDGDVCGIWPPKMPVVSLTFMTLVIGGFFVGFYMLTDRLVENASLSWRIFIIVLGCVTTIGAPLAHVLTVLHRQKRGPVLVYHKLHRRVELPRIGETFELEDVVCLQVLAVRYKGDQHAELNLLCLKDGQRKRHLLLTAMNSFDSAFDFLLKPIREEGVPIRILKIEEKLFSKQLQICEV